MDECFGVFQFSYVCGFGSRQYLGASTKGQQAALAWIPRFTGLLSAIGSSLILWDILVSKKNARSRSLTSLQHLVCGMSIFDLFGSVGNMLSTIPIPENQNFESSSTSIPTGVYGAKGNSGTCAAQGFFYSIGLYERFLQFSAECVLCPSHEEGDA